MKKIISVLNILLIISCTNSYLKEDTDLFKEKLSGSVKKYTELQFKPLGKSLRQNEENIGLRLKTSNTFNKEGFSIENSIRSAGGKKSIKRISEYNKKMQLIRQKQFKGADTLPLIIEDYKYNKEGEISEHIYFKKGKEVSKTIYEYNEINVRTGRVYNQKGIVSSVYSVLYNAEGNITDDTKYDRDSESISYKIHNSYDFAGNLTMTETYYPVGNNFSISKKDSVGNEIELRKYTDGLIVSSCFYSYDGRGNQTDVRCDIYDSKVKRTINSSIKYEYDKEGNWIKRVRFQEGTISYVTERTYVYY
jgi:hypothetical protein